MSAHRFALCVGGTGGIGNAVARRLAQHDINVIIVGRNEKAGKETVESLKQIYSSGFHKFIPCDASLMSNIRNVCGDIKKEIPMLNYCVFAQGMVSMQKRNETIEGIDHKMALHYYGRIQFIEEMLPLLRVGADEMCDAKVLSVLSAGEHQPYLQKADLHLRNNYTLSDVANATGFYTDLAFDRYSRQDGTVPQDSVGSRGVTTGGEGASTEEEEGDVVVDPDNDNTGISFVHMNPGNVKTNWGRSLASPIHRMLAKVVQLGGLSPDQAAENISVPLLSAHIGKVGGFYLLGKTGEAVNSTSGHGEMWREEVWRHTMDVLKSTVKKEVKAEAKVEQEVDDGGVMNITS